MNIMAIRGKSKLFGVIAVIFGSLTASYASPTRADLQAKIADLSAKTTTLETSVATLLADQKKLMASTNLDKSSLFVVGVSTGNVAGSKVTIPLSFLAGPVPVSAIQADLVLSSSFSVVSITVGPAATAAGKSVQSNIAGQSARLIIFGVNQTPMSSGVVAYLTIQSLPIAPKGNAQIFSLNAVASDKDGNTVLLTNTSGLVVLK